MSGSDLNIVVDGDADENMPVPSLENVRRDAAEAPNVRRQIQVPVGSNVAAPFDDALAGRRLQDLLPDLYTYSTKARCDDIPHDLVEEVLWTLETQLDCWANDPSTLTQILLHSQAFITLKLVALYTRPDVERPDRAVEHMRNLLSLRRGGIPIWNLSMFPLEINFRYAVALAKVAVDDDEAERILVSFLVADHPKAFDAASRIKAQLYLSRVLRRNGSLQEASAMESELIRWFKRNPHVLFDTDLESMFPSDPDASRSDPVLVGLGGRSWLEIRKRTVKTETRRAKSCAHCYNQDFRVTLKACGACKETWYCSVKCQKDNWPFHKELCKYLVKFGKQSTLIRQESDSTQEKRRKLHEWGNWDMRINMHVLVHALGLHRDPKRGKAHIFHKEVEYNPSANSIPKTFTVSSCGVFRLDDVLGGLEKDLGLAKGKGREHFANYFHPFESDNMSHMVPMVEIVSNRREKVHTIICVGISLGEIDQLTYDSNWMQSVNRRGTQAPRAILQWHGAKDAEHDF